MKVEAAIFFGVTAFFSVIAAVYWFTSYEDAGSVMLVASAGLGVVTAAYLAFHARRISPRPEDRTDARVSDGAGVIGDFPTASISPVALALGATTIGVGLVTSVGVVLVGVVVFAIAVAAMLHESQDRVTNR